MVNEQFLVEEVYDRELAFAEQYEQADELSTSSDTDSQESQPLTTGNPIAYGTINL